MRKDDTSLQDNPLLQKTDLPLFDQIKPEHVIPAVRHILSRAETNLQKIEKNAAPTWNDLLKPLEELEVPFEYAWGPIGHLLGVKNSEELRDAHESVLNEVVSFSLRLNQSPVIYKTLEVIRNGDEWTKLDPAQQRVIELKLRAARHAGVALEGQEKERFNEIANELSQLQTKFSNNVLDATKQFSLTITKPEDIKGWPENLKQLSAQSYNQENPEDEKKASGDAGPWRITLDLPSFIPFMQHSQNRQQRHELYHAYITRASEGDWDNRNIIQKLLALRKEKAHLLGFNSFAELSLDSKMAPDVQAVDRMSQELITAARPYSDADFKDMQKLATDSGQTDPLEHWDLAYWSERLREKRFEYTENEIRQYFQLPKVIEGLFSLVQRLFSIIVEPDNQAIPKWHPDVQYYKVLDKDGKPLASFFLDPYSRPHEKRGGAWMDECLGRRWLDNKLRLPVIHLCCNGTPPVGDQPSLMSFGEVTTLFHEFGHGLQGMLTQIDYAAVSGINGVEWDAVELPSQFMENWCYHQPTLTGMTAHVETGEPLPDELFYKIKAAKNYQSGYATIRQLLFGMSDMRLHNEFNPDGTEPPSEVYRALARKLLPIPPYESEQFLCAFGHIFGGGYSAGYYSYKWAEVLSADAFSAFEEAGLDNAVAISETGARFRDTILATGGAAHPMQVFKRFRGREPSTEALLRHSGLQTVS
jgi:oligopeptidase A